MNKYESYKESGVNWIGLIPREWNLIPIKYSDETIMGQSPSSNDYLLEEIPDAIPFLQGNAEFGKLNPKARLWCNEANKHSKKNDILISVRAPIGAVNISDKIYGIGRGLSAVRGVKHTYKFLYYYLHFANEFLNVQGTGSTFTAISTSVLKELLIPNISSNDQTQIAKYLDHKTQIIDTLIEKKEQLIQKLQSQRQAIINEAVTKGLNPNTKMKDSGIEWLGEIPEHWEVKRVSTVSKLLTGFPWKSNQFNFEKGTKILRGENVSEGFLRWGGRTRFWPLKIEQDSIYWVKSNDIIIPMDGSKVGKNFVLIKEEDLPMILHQRMCRLRFNNDILAAFIAYYISSDMFQYHVNSTKTDPMIPHITQKNIADFKFALPPDNEITAIIEYCSNVLNSCDFILNKTVDSLVLLKSYRQSIISEAVTGKIDLRDWQSPTKN